MHDCRCSWITCVAFTLKEFHGKFKKYLHSHLKQSYTSGRRLKPEKLKIVYKPGMRQLHPLIVSWFVVVVQ